MTKDILYFDHAATTQCCSEAANEMSRLSCEDFGNPSSTHALGKTAFAAISSARSFFATEFAIPPEQVIFTGSGTESDNLAILGVCLKALTERKDGALPLRIIISAIEHPAVRQSAESLRDFGFDVQYAPVDENGKVITKTLLNWVDERTVLVSVMAVNNITGSVQPISELAAQIKKKNPNTLFHTDAVQAFGKTTLPTSASQVDLLSISAHKVNGPKGIGALIVLNSEILSKKLLRPLIWGGGQEGGLRSGTQSPALIAAFHKAAERALTNRAKSEKKVRKLHQIFLKELAQMGILDSFEKSGKLRNNSPEDAVPHIISLSVPHYPTQHLVKLLESKGCLLSTGSACSAGKSSEEKVLVAMNLSREICSSALRISLSEGNSEQDVRNLAQAISDSLKEMNQLLGIA